MNMLAAGAFQTFVNTIFENWQMILFVLLAVLLLLTIIFKRFKTTAFILSVIVIAIAVVLLVSLITEALTWKPVDLVSFLVRWVPTVIFTATVVLAVIFGMARGLRKSLILLLHEVVAGAVCIILFAVLINLPQTDAFMLKIVDFFMGGSGSLQNALHVSAPCEGLKDVFVEWLPTVLKGDFSVMLGESKAYIYTLADLIYHIGFAVILYVLFLVLDFILYILYHCFYSERKYKKKTEERYTQNKVDRRYSKHVVGGGVVGAVRGVTIGLLSMAFLGTVLFSVAGRGEGKLKDYDFENENYNTYYSVYRSVESYGNYGIFKVLNAVSSPEEAPYYLFAADLIFSGRLNDEELGVSGNIVFREELAAYTGFARDTADLVMKYGGEKITALLNNKADKKAFDTVLEIMSDEQFKVEFRDLIGEFDAQTYIFNFAMSFINSAIANIDDMSFAQSVSAGNREILKILFTKNYLSDEIPDEKLLKATPVSHLEPRPYLNVAKFVTKEDVQILYGVVIDALTHKTGNVNETIGLIADLIPQLRKISLLSEERAAEINPVLGRLYCYAANRYLSEEGSQGITYAEIYDDNIEWVGEINMLLDVTDAAYGLYKNVYSEGVKPYDAMLAVFDKDGAHYAENCAYYDEVCDSVIKSRVLGKAMSTSYVYKLIEKALSGVVEGIYIPTDIKYETTFGENGEVVEAGEVYNLLNGVRLLGRESTILSTLKDFGSTKDMQGLLDSLAAVVATEDENGVKASDYLVNSKLIRSVLSASIINFGEEYIYVPQIARETDGSGNKVNLITKDEMSVLFGNLPDLIDFISPVMKGEGDVNSAIAEFVKKDVFRTLLDGSAVFEGTAAKLMVKAMGDNGTVVIPAALKNDYELWVSASSKRGELKNLISGVDTAGIDIADTVNGKIDEKAVLDNVLALTSEQLDMCFKSSVLHYTISKFITGENLDFGSFKVIVPEAAKTVLKEDSLDSVVKKEELKFIVSVAADFDLSENSDISSVFAKLVQNKSLLQESYLLSASVAYSVVNNADTADILEIPKKLADAATVERLEKFNSSNPWKNEVIRLVDALDEVLGISASEEFTFDKDKLENSMSALLKDFNGVSAVNPKTTKLAVCTGSEVVNCSITKKLDDILQGNIDQNLLYGAKSGGYYSQKELSALSNSLNVFGIDVDKIDADTITDSVKKQLLTLNDAAEEFGVGSKLDMIYPSVIISGMLSKELDDALLKAEDEDGNVSPLIDEDVLTAIKGGESRYPQSEISALIDSLNAFGIASIENLDSLDFDDLISKRDRFDEIYASNVVKGALTKQIKSNNELGVDHEKAYESDIKVLRQNEVESMLDLVDFIRKDKPEQSIENLYFDQISLGNIRTCLFDGDGGVKSYLILSAVSDSLKSNSHIVVNKSLVDGYGCIEENEMRSLIDGFIALDSNGGDVNINEWTKINNGVFEYPDAEKRAVAFESEILRAKLTDQLIVENNRITPVRDYYVSTNNCTKFTDTFNRTRLLISKTELAALFSVLDDYTDGRSFAIPNLNYVSLQEKYLELGEEGGSAYVTKVFRSDVLRYNVSASIPAEVVAAFGFEATKEQAVNINDGGISERSVYTEEQIKQLLI